MTSAYYELLKDLIQFRTDPQINRSYYLISLSVRDDVNNYVDKVYGDFQLTDSCRTSVITYDCYKKAVSTDAHNLNSSYSVDIIQAVNYYINSIIGLLYKAGASGSEECYALLKDMLDHYFDPLLKSEMTLTWIKDKMCHKKKIGDVCLQAFWDYIFVNFDDNKTALARKIYDSFDRSNMEIIDVDSNISINRPESNNSDTCSLDQDRCSLRKTSLIRNRLATKSATSPQSMDYCSNVRNMNSCSTRNRTDSSLTDNTTSKSSTSVFQPFASLKKTEYAVNNTYNSRKYNKNANNRQTKHVKKRRGDLLLDNEAVTSSSDMLTVEEHNRMFSY